jgi:hypothetical protein
MKSKNSVALARAFITSCGVFIIGILFVLVQAVAAGGVSGKEWFAVPLSGFFVAFPAFLVAFPLCVVGFFLRAHLHDHHPRQ